MRFLQVGFRVSERRACRVIGMHRTRYRYRSRAQDQASLRQRIREIAAVRVRCGQCRVSWRSNEVPSHQPPAAYAAPTL